MFVVVCVVGGVAAVAALATGGDPAQAFGDVVSDVAVGDLQGGELFDRIIAQGNFDE